VILLVGFRNNRSTREEEHDARQNVKITNKQDNKFNNIPIIVLKAFLPDIKNNPYSKLVDAVLLKPTDLKG